MIPGFATCGLWRALIYEVAFRSTEPPFRGWMGVLPGLRATRRSNRPAVQNVPVSGMGHQFEDFFCWGSTFMRNSAGWLVPQATICLVYIATI